jgi:hypothetical protein
MAHREIKLRIFPDGRVVADVVGVPGPACVQYIPLVEQLVGGEVTDSHRTLEYASVEAAVDTESAASEVARLLGKA